MTNYDYRRLMDRIGETTLAVLACSFMFFVSTACLVGAFEILKFAFTGGK